MSLTSAAGEPAESNHEGSTVPRISTGAADDASGAPLLRGVRVVLFAVNVPGPVAAARLSGMGATVTKIEPPAGDQLARLCPEWYEAIHRGIDVRRLDLRLPEAISHFHALLDSADLLLVSYRPSSLARLGLDNGSLARAHPALCVVTIVGFPGTRADLAGHDLTYQAQAGLLAPPDMPRSLLADLGGAERAVSASLALLFSRERDRRGIRDAARARDRERDDERGSSSRFIEVSLADAVHALSAPYSFGLTTSGGPLGGGFPLYGLYAATDGWIAVAALETHFAARLVAELGVRDATRESLAALFATNSASTWEAWAAERDLPIAAVRQW